MSMHIMAPVAGVPCVDAGAQADPTCLLQRMQRTVDAEGTQPAEDDVDASAEGPAEEDPVEQFIRTLYQNEFMRLMLFGDEEKLGTSAEAWD